MASRWLLCTEGVHALPPGTPFNRQHHGSFANPAGKQDMSHIEFGPYTAQLPRVVTAW